MLIELFWPILEKSASAICGKLMAPSGEHPSKLS
jgi:hypothetical protein